MKEKTNASIWWADLWFFMWLYLHITHDKPLWICFMAYAAQMFVALLLLAYKELKIESKVRLFFLKRRLLKTAKKNGYKGTDVRVW